MSSSDTDISQCSTISSISVLAERAENIHFDVSTFIPLPRLSGRHSTVARQKFKPTASEGIYAKLVKESANTEFIAQNLIRSIEEDLNNIHQLLQIIPDLLCIDYKIESYSSQEYDMQIGTRLQVAASEQENILKCDILLTHESNYAKNLSNTLDLFLWQFCKQLTWVTQTLPIFRVVMRNFISFMRHLAKSEMDALRLTAYLFAFRLNKHLCVRRVQVALNCNIDLDSAAILYDAIDNVINRNKLDAIYTGIQHNHHFQVFYDEFARYNRVCILADDGRQFANEKNITFMGHLLETKKAQIVKDILTSCILLMQMPHLRHVYDTAAFTALVERIYRRMNHTNDSIAILAATFFTVAFQYRHWALPTIDEIIHRMVVRCYSVNLHLARRFAEGVAFYLKQFESDEVFKLIIKLANNFDDNTCKRVTTVKYSYLVESLYKYLPELDPCSILAKLLSKTSHDDENFAAMMEIFYHSCCIHYNGKLSIERKRDINVAVCEDREMYLLSQHLLEKFTKLMKITINNAANMTCLFKALALLPYSSVDLYQLKNVLDTVVNESLELFKWKEINEELWRSVVQFVSRASQMQGGDSYVLKLEVVLDTTIQHYRKCMLEFRSETTSTHLLLDWISEMKCALTKIKILFTCNVSVRDFDFAWFYNFWVDSDLPEEIVCEQITCCALHIKCQVQEITQAARAFDVAGLRRLKSEAHSFWVSLDELFTAKPHFFSAIFEAMGTLISNYLLLLSPGVVSDSSILAGFKYWQCWRSADEIFDMFWEDCVLQNEDTADILLAKRRKYFHIALRLFYLPNKSNALSPYIIKMIAYSGKCYALHKTAYKSFFNELSSHSKEFFHLITLVLQYIREIEKEWSDDDVVELCKLLSRFLLGKERVQFIQFYIDFAMEKSDYAILRDVKLFSFQLTEKERAKVVEYAQRVLAIADDNLDILGL